jgi:hypothetical protein
MEPGIPAGALILSSKRKKVVAGVLAVVALCIFLPPNINGALQQEAAGTNRKPPGREVKIGS